MALQKTPPIPSPANASRPALPSPSAASKAPEGGQPSSTPFWVGLSVSISWVGAVLAIIAKAGPAHTLGGIPLVDWAIGISAAVSPVAMVWMITAYMQRAGDIQSIADPLRRQLTLITGESGAADARIRRFNQAIREQIELLRSAQTLSQDDLEEVMNRVRNHRVDLERFESASTQQVKEIQDVVRRSMFQVEQMMDDKFTMLRVLDDKLQKNGDGVARQVEGVGEQVATMLEEVERASAQIADALERAQRDSKRLSETSRLQESSLTQAAETASETLGGLSSRIDLSVARFLERASTAREEAERLAHTLDAQTRALDEFSTTLPARVSEAEAVLRGVADRLYASEQMAREQAVNLSEKLSQQLDGLHSFMDRFTGRLTDIDQGLDRRQYDLNNLSDRIGSTTTEFISSWEKSLTDLHERTGSSLSRFAVANDEARRNAEGVAAHLSETSNKYEDVVARMRALSTDSNAQMMGMTEEVTRHLAQFESLSKASNLAGEEVQKRAATAMQNLQHVLERVLAAREATQAVGETLVRDINQSVDQNEKMIARLTDAAQQGARAVTVAAENFGRQQGELVGKTRAGESLFVESVQKIQLQAESTTKSLREQNAQLMSLLSETQTQLSATDHKLQGFAATAVVPVQKAMQQMDASADQGLRTLSHFGEGLTMQVNRLQDFHARIGGMSQDMTKTTAETVGALEGLSQRFYTTRSSQEEAVRQTLAQFTEMSERLQREVQGMDSQTAHSLEMLQQAAMKVGEQSYQMLENVKASGTQMKDVTSVLQAEAAQIQTVLRQQSESIGVDLSRAEQRFSSLGESIRERADAAYAMLDRVAAHYDEVSTSSLARGEGRLTAAGESLRLTSESATELLDKAAAHYNAAARNVDHVVGSAQGKAENLHTIMVQQADRIHNDAQRIEMQATEIATSTGRAVQNLSALSDKLAITHESAIDYSQQSLSRIDETTDAFQRRTTDLVLAAQNATDAVAGAGAAFGEQTGRLVDSGQLVDGVLRQLTMATSALADHAAQVRVSMEQQNNRLLAQLSDSVAQLDVTGGKLQQIATFANQGADQVSLRFADMTDTATKRISATSRDLLAVAEVADTTLAELGVNITQQAASLSIVGEQVSEQQRLLAAANESHRLQMVDLFDKLGSSHAQASEVAERSIAYLTTSLQEISRQMGAVGDQSQAAVGNVRMASMGFSEEAASLLQNAQAAEQQARTVLAVTATLQEQARHLRESLQAESERAGESLAVVLNRLTVGGAEVRELGASTGTMFNSLQRAISDQGNELGLSMQQITDRQRTLTSALDQQRESINALLNRMTLAQDETAALAERTSTRLSDSTQQITRHVETLDIRSQSALTNVQAAASGFAQEAEAIETHARQAEQQARSIMATASGMQEQISGLRTSMQTEGERTNAIFTSLLDKVSSGAAEIRDLSASTEMSLISLGNNVTQQSGALSTTMQQIGDRQRSLATALDAQRDVINGLLNRFSTAQSETAAAADRAAARLSEGAQQIESHVDAIDTRAKSALANIQAATESFTVEAQAIDTEARHAEQQAQAILAAASGLHGQIYDLRTSMQNDGERANAVISGLLNRVSSGSGELRDATQTTETALTSLQGAITQQSSELSRSMQEVSERQRSLSTVLEQQRETISALLGKFAQAQDETATVADRAAERINDGAQKMAQNLDLIGAQAHTTLASVQTAVTGFTEQSEILRQQSQLSEQQVRGVLSVTAGMQEQAQHLREAMQVETARVVEQLSIVIAQLDTTGRQLRSETGEAMNALDQTAARFVTTTETGSEMIRKQAEVLTQSADQSEARLTNAGEKIRSHLRLVGEVGDKAEQQAQQIANAAEFATTRLASLRDTLDLSDKDGQDVVAVTSQRIEDVKLILQSQLQHLSTFTQQAVEQVTAASHGLAQQNEALRANLSASESALSEAADLVREESKQMPVSLNRSVAGIEAVTRALKDQATQVDQSLSSTAERFAAVSASARNDMIEEMNRVSTVADEASKILTGFNQLLAEQVANMQQSTAQLSGEQRDLVEKASQGVGVLTETSNRLASLRSEAALTAERLMREFDQLDQRAVASGARLTQAGEGITKQLDAITTASARAETQMSGASQGLRDQLERARAGLQTQIEDINRGLMQITAQLERTGTTLRSTTVGAVADVERVGQRFEQTTSEAAGQVDGRVNQLREATDAVAQILGSFGGKFDEALTQMAQAGTSIKRQEGDALVHMKTMITMLGSVAEKLEAARAMSGDVGQHAVERLSEVVGAVQAQMNTMTTSAQTAAGIMRGIGQIYNDQTVSLTKGVGEAHTQVLTMNKSIDDMQQRTDHMRTSLKLQGDELMNALRQILAQLELTGDGLSEAVTHTLQRQIAAEMKKIN